MNAPDYSLPVTHPSSLRFARRWLLLGVVALAAAGVFAGLLGSVTSALFYKLLVVHVDLSILVWFLSQACMFFALASNGRGIAVVQNTAFASFGLGTLLLAVSVFMPGEAYRSNYIPVIFHPVFFLGLSLILCGVLSSIADLLIACAPGKVETSAWGIRGAAYILIIAAGCFLWSVREIPSNLAGQVFYEFAFWGGGHVLQLAYTQLLLVCWIWLAGISGIRIHLTRFWLMVLYIWGVLIALCMLGVYFKYIASTDEFRALFTMLMRQANGSAALILIVLITLGLFTSTSSAGTRLFRASLYMSVLVFTAGGVLGYMIIGSNVIIPAHYHGSIVGVTLALMGVSYWLLPHFGYRDVSLSKVAFAQPLIYGGGQLCWMTGMYILGAHGVPRKTPGSADTVNVFASVLKHGGDGIALIGGLLFVFVVLRAVYQSRRNSA